MSLDTDSLEYDLLREAVLSVADVPGLTCEIGVRMGGGSQVIMAASLPDRVHVGVDPWGNLPYETRDGIRHERSGYGDNMRRRCLAELYQWAAFEGRDLLLFVLDDEAFFRRYADGVPFYQDGWRLMLNSYALVCFDASHSTEAVAREAAFFGPRSAPGACWVFDDYQCYTLPDVAQWGFRLVRQGERKIVFRR